MSKKFTVILILLGLVVIGAFLGLGIWRSADMTPSFETGGYVLEEEQESIHLLSFRAGEEYISDLAGTVSFTTVDGEKATIARQSFVHLDDGSVMSLSDGVLLDLNDLSENFINNYYITTALPIAENGGTYTAETDSGSMRFGENVWKLSDDNYIVRSPELRVYFSETDVRDAGDYVEVVITNDQVASLRTEENLWMTISPECYIQTASGVKIYPITQLVDDGNYKLSLAKLAVSPEDAIVLTQDETRRQIVPELNIETIDGEDGEDGEAGEAGISGEDGADGTDSEAGVDGEAGQKGADGDSGNTGETGGDGGGGAGGADGDAGKNGGQGASGKDAVVSGSTNKALPTIAVQEWNITPDTLSGSFRWSDPSAFFEGIEDKDWNRYPATVTITDVKTGEKITVYEVTETYKPGTGEVPDVSNFTGFYSGTNPVYFSTRDAVLKPDTEYRLTVTAYYKSTDDTGLIYSREFLNRSFFTSSTGVTLAYEKATPNSVTVSANTTLDYQANLDTVQVFLMTKTQSENFTAATVNDTTGYLMMANVDLKSGLSRDITFGDNATPLDPNRKYYARVYVTTTAGVSAVTTQELELMTLKRSPETEEDAKPVANYNRVTGGYEVWRPTVTDPDNGAQSYIYTAYRWDENAKDWVEEAQRTISAEASEPVDFRLPSGADYRFGVEMEFYDNEKTVYYDLGTSESIQGVGDTMPRLSLIPDSAGAQYNAYKGILRIAVTGEKTLIAEPSQSTPVTLEIFADQVQNSSVEMVQAQRAYNVNGVNNTLGTVTYVGKDATQNLNYYDITLNLDNLYQNTNYSLTVYGYLDLGDGNGSVKRAIGTVSFRTYETLKLSGDWQVLDAEGRAFRRMLTLSVADGNATNDTRPYTETELKGGQVMLELYSGIGTGKLPVGSAPISDPDDLLALYSTGLEINESTFGSNLTLNPTANYTLSISSVADGSYNLGLSYINEFEVASGDSIPVAAEAIPPDLLADPTGGVIATAIENKDAETYGAKIDDSLPGDAIIGYTLEATYDNIQRIGKTITYYAFEFNSFINALGSNENPIDAGAYLPIEMTYNIDSGSDQVPKVALLFGAAKANAPTSVPGYQVVYAGEAAYTEAALNAGMARGFRYLFAYTVQYSAGTDSGATRRYPDSHPDYSSYNRAYGGVSLNGKSLGRGVAYVLSSGMVETPSILPDFHTYVNKAEPAELSSATSTTAEGTVELHYTWRDPDKLIVTDGTDNNTVVSFVVDNSVSTQKIQEYKVGDLANWYTVTIRYTVQKGVSELVEPQVNIRAYHIDYNDTLSLFNYEDDDLDSSTMPLSQIPVDWNWESQFAQSTHAGKVFVTMDMSKENLDQNFIDFELSGEAGNFTVIDDVVARAVAMKLVITLEGGGSQKEFLLPLYQDVGVTYARLATGRLGTDYVGKSFVVTSAQLIYDTGDQGWELAVPGGQFAVQYTNNEDHEAGFAGYMNAKGDSSIAANSGLLSLPTDSAFSLASLRSTVASQLKDDTKVYFSVRNLVQGSGTWPYLYPSQLGVDSGTSSDASQLSGRYIVPKRTAAFNLTFATTDGNKGELGSMTPTMTQTSFSASMNSIGVNGLQVTGLENGGTIHMAAFLTYDQALSLTGARQDISITIGTNGKPSVETPTLSGLTAKTNYFIAFYYTQADGSKVMLLKGEDSTKAIYEVTSSSDVVITVKEKSYSNESYFDKDVIMKFTLSRVFEVSMRYDIFLDLETAEKAATVDEIKAGAHLKFEDMNTTDATTDILGEPKAFTASNNQLILDLLPSMNRSKLVPGTTYYLRFTALEGDDTIAGSHVEEFTIDPVGNYGAVIYTSRAEAREIRFQVTINDPQYTFMTVNSNEGKTGGGLYAVRFTDANGNRLRTTYDDKVYAMSETGQIRREFILNDETLLNDSLQIDTNKQMTANTSYTINVYAVPDNNHDGLVELAAEVKLENGLVEKSKGEKVAWDYFFDKSAASLSESGSKFLYILNSCWDNGTFPVAANAALGQQFLIATQTQSTTSDDQPWILDEKAAYAYNYNGTTIRVVLENSFGLIDDKTSMPVFKQIDWRVTGIRSDGSPYDQNGTSLYTNTDDVLIQYGSVIGGYSGYYFDIPAQVGTGSYTVILQFRVEEGSAAAQGKISTRATS